ncbi:MAG: ABC transporter permease [Bacillota bacterium]
MFSYIVRRLFSLIPIIIGVTLAIFLLLNVLPGNPARLMAGPYAPQETVDSIAETMGFNDPLPKQYFRFLGNLLQGDLGTSFRSRNAVAGEVAAVFPKTLLLAFTSQIFSVVVGVFLGMVAALRRGSLADRLVMIAGVLGLSLPAFFLALLLQIIFSVFLGLLPPSGYGGLDLHIIMPTLALGIPGAGWMARVSRSAFLEVLPQDFMRTLRAKGLPENKVIWKHVLKNALVPIISLIGTDFSAKLAGIIVVEYIFSWPGIGKYGYDALFAKDMPALQATIIVLTISVCIVNLVVDILYAVIDKRIRFTKTGE